MSVFSTKRNLSSKPSFHSYLDEEFDVTHDPRHITVDQVCEAYFCNGARKNPV